MEALIRTVQTTSSKKDNKKSSGPRDLWSFRTHFIGALLSVVGTIILLILHLGEPFGTVMTYAVFGFALIALYTCSAVYHYYQGNEQTYNRLRKLDHSMIYVLIAGTYTPIMANGMPEPKATVFLWGIWGFALLGIVVKVCWLNAPRWLYTSIYILMGWAIIFDPKALFSMQQSFVVLLLAGGIAYTAGAVLYILKKPNIFERFGFHEIFHVFIMIGSLCHFIAVAFFI